MSGPCSLCHPSKSVSWKISTFYFQVQGRIEKEQNSRVDAATSDIRRQIDRLISDGYAKQIFEDDIYVYIDIGDGNRTFSARNKYLDSVEGPSPSRWSFNDKNPEQIKVRVGTMSKRDAPFTWEWRASFTYDFGKNNDVKYVLKNDVSSYNFKSSDPADIEYFAACGEILKALSKVNWGKILTTDPYEGMEELYKQYPSKPDASVLIPEGATDKYGEKLYSKYNTAIKDADIADALEEWKKGEKWLYVGTPRGSYHYRYQDTENDPYYDTTTSLMQENEFYKGWYKYRKNHC